MKKPTIIRTGGAFEADPKTGELKRTEPEMQEPEQVQLIEETAAEPVKDPAAAVPPAAPATAAVQPPKKED